MLIMTVHPPRHNYLNSRKDYECIPLVLPSAENRTLAFQKIHLLLKFREILPLLPVSTHVDAVWYGLQFHHHSSHRFLGNRTHHICRQIAKVSRPSRYCTSITGFRRFHIEFSAGHYRRTEIIFMNYVEAELFARQCIPYCRVFSSSEAAF